MYGIYHGPIGIHDIADRVNGLTELLRANLFKGGFKVN